MSRKFNELTPDDLAKLPCLSQNHYCIAEERIHMHLSNEKKMHWYLAEYGPIWQKVLRVFRG